MNPLKLTLKGFKGIKSGLGRDEVTIDLQVDGELIAIVGPNGAGKSTLFKMITGQDKPDTGDVVIHRPTGEQWIVAYVRGFGFNHLADLIFKGRHHDEKR